MRHTYKNFSPSSIYNCAAILPFAIHSSTTRIGNTNCLFVFLHVTYSYISQCLVYKQYTIYEYFMGYLEIIFFFCFFLNTTLGRGENGPHVVEYFDQHYLRFLFFSQPSTAAYVNVGVFLTRAFLCMSNITAE